MINKTLPLFETPNIEIYEFDKMTDKTDLIPHDSMRISRPKLVYNEIRTIS